MILSGIGISDSRRPAVPVGDSIRTAIGASYQSTYDSAAVGDWIEVNSTAYSNVLSQVSGSTVYGFSDAVMSGSSGIGWGNFMVSNPAQTPIPLGNYIIAWSCIPSNNGTQIIYSSSTLSSSTYTRIGNNLSVSGSAGARKYFVRKAPTDITSISNTYIGWYSSSGMVTKGPNTISQVYKSAGGSTVTTPFSIWGGNVPAPGLQYLCTNVLSW